MTDTIEPIDIGRCTITEKLRFIGQVTGGGTGGPGRVYKIVDFDRTVGSPYEQDNRSGSKRSGNCVWQLEADQLYRIENVAVSSRETSTFYVTTDGGQALELSRDQYNAERARRWPMAAQLAVEAAEQRRRDEAARIEREAAAAEIRRLENEALKELNEERAAEIAETGQPVVEGLPELKGTPKQIAYALSIRDAFAKKHPSDAALKRGSTAKYWIENHRSVLFNR